VRFLWCGGLGRFVAVFGVWGMFMFLGLSLWGWCLGVVVLVGGVGLVVLCGVGFGCDEVWF